MEARGVVLFYGKTCKCISVGVNNRIWLVIGYLSKYISQISRVTAITTACIYLCGDFGIESISVI